jgi:hypothetical protein
VLLRRRPGLDRHQPAGGLDRTHVHAREQLGTLRIRPAGGEEGDRRRVVVGDQLGVAALQLGLAFEEAQHRAAGGAFLEVQHGQQGVREGIERGALGRLSGQQLCVLADLRGMPVKDEILLAWEVPVDRAGRDARGLGDLFDRRLGVPLVEEELLRRGHDLGPRAGAVSIAERRAGLGHGQSLTS